MTDNIAEQNSGQKHTIRNLVDLACFAKDFLVDLDKISKNKAQGPRTSATIIALRGDLGSGKTAFVKECAKLLGVEGDITSPTFVIMKRYGLGAGREVGRFFINLIHIDAYRLGKTEDLNAIGWSKLVADPGNLIMIEWPERVEVGIVAGGASDFGRNFVTIDIEHLEDGNRVFLTNFVG